VELEHRQEGVLEFDTCAPEVGKRKLREVDGDEGLLWKKIELQCATLLLL
jgi:hypothetical protein